MVSKEGPEEGLGPGVVAVIVDVEDRSLAIYPFELNCHYVVCC